MTDPSSEPRIVTLDGWRGVSILAVILQHLAIRSNFRFMEWANLGSLGVDTFFVISGYIITFRFLREKQQNSKIDLRAFYIRRCFRILPLVSAYLLTVFTLSRFFVLNGYFHPSEIVGSIFFFRNYQIAATIGGVFTRHFWSLSIEEHFYIVWPALLLFLGNRRALWFAVSGAIACGVWRFYDSTHPDSWLGKMLPGSDPWLRQIRTDARVDGLLLGCAIAICLSSPRVHEFVLRNFPKETPLVTAFLLLLNFQHANGWATLSSYVLISLMMVSTLVVQEGVVYRWLNSRSLVWIGTISYSTYIWQQMFFAGTAGDKSPFGVIASFPFNLICVLIVSTLSFYFLEKPCIQLGRRFATRSNRTAPALRSGVSLEGVQN